MTIIKAAIEALKLEERPMTAEELYDAICRRKLYSFGAKDPLSILRSELRRHTVSFTGKTKSPISLLKEEGKRYSPL